MKTINQAIDEVKNFPNASLFFGMAIILIVLLTISNLHNNKNRSEVQVFFEYQIVDNDTILTRITCDARIQEFPYLDDYVWEDIPTKSWKNNGINYIPIKVNINKR